MNNIIKLYNDNPKAIIILVIVFIIILFLYLQKDVLIKSPYQKKQNKNNKHNKKNIPLKINTEPNVDGIVFGYIKILGKKQLYYSPAEDEGHIIVVGGSGMGKTSSILIPTLNAFCKRNINNSSFTIDISADIIGNVNMPNKLEYKPLDNTCIPYNIFKPIDELEQLYKKRKALSNLAYILMPSTKEDNGAGKYFQDEGRKILTASLIGFYEAGEDFCNICKIVYTNNWRNLFNKIDSLNNEYASSLLSSFDSEIPEQYIASSKQNCDDAISLFYTDETIASNIRRPKEDEESFDVTKIETHNVFINIPDEDLEYLQPLTQVLTSQVLNFFSKRDLNYSHQILFNLDEAASLGNIDLLPACRKYRKRGIRLNVLTQSLSDIDLTWGESNTKTREALMSNFKYKIILNSSEPSEQKYWADLIGREIKDSFSHTTGHSSSSTYSDTKDYIIEPYELANLGDSLILIYPGGYIKLSKNFYYK